MRDYPVGDYLTIARINHPNRTAVVSDPEGAALTYAELDDSTDRVANAFTAAGLKPGDRIACWLGTGIPYLQVYLAAAKANLSVVPVNERFTAEEAAYIVGDSQARVVVFDEARAAAVEELDPGTEVWRIAVGAHRPGGATPFGELLTAAAGRPAVAVSGQDPLIVGYTSGTTGFPKGALLTHAGLLNINRNNALVYRLPMASVGVYSGAMSFTATVPAFILTHLFVAGTVVFSGTRDPEHVTRLVERHGANYISVPPPLVDDYTAVFRAYPERIRSLTSVLQGAGKVPAESLAPLNESLGGRLLLGWGMTEHSGGLATATTRADMDRALNGDLRVLESVGTACPGVAIVLRDADGSELPHDGETVGELVFRSPCLMAGYWNNPEATQRAIRDGWYHSGDLGSIDERGYVYVAGRRDDLIVSGGMNVYPSEVERVLLQAPGVTDAAVVGVPHERWGQAVAAAVVVSDSQVTPERIVDYCRSRLASYKKPTSVLFVPELPKNLSGKIARNDVRALFPRA